MEATHAQPSTSTTFVDMTPLQSFEANELHTGMGAGTSLDELAWMLTSQPVGAHGKLLQALLLISTSKAWPSGCTRIPAPVQLRSEQQD